MPLVLVILFLLIVGFLIYVFASQPYLPPETDTIIDRVLHSALANVVVGQTGFATSHGLQIWYESILPEQAPKGSVLLVMGIAGNALDWPPKFARTFVDAGYQVIRYDHRGTGLSDWVENWDRKHPYSL